MKSKRLTITVAAAILVIAAVTVLLWQFLREPELTLSNAETGHVYARLPLEEGDSFSVTFRHSVNKSNVTEIYERRGDSIWLTGCVYYDFGAGVAEVLDPSWELSIGDNGEMILSGINMEMTDLTYIVGTVYDHIMCINGEETVLNELCGRNTKVHFSIK